MTPAIVISLKTIKALQNGVATHSGATVLFSMRAVSLASCLVKRGNNSSAEIKYSEIPFVSILDEAETAAKPVTNQIDSKFQGEKKDRITSNLEY